MLAVTYLLENQLTPSECEELMNHLNKAFEAKSGENKVNLSKPFRISPRESLVIAIAFGEKDAFWLGQVTEEIFNQWHELKGIESDTNRNRPWTCCDEVHLAVYSALWKKLEPAKTIVADNA